MARTVDISRFSPELSIAAQALGSRIRKARHHRRLRVEDVAEKAQVSKKTVEAVEKGSLTTSFGAYLAVLASLSLAKEVALLADPALDQEGADLIYEPGERRVRPSRKVDNDF